MSFRLSADIFPRCAAYAIITLLLPPFIAERPLSDGAIAEACLLFFSAILFSLSLFIIFFAATPPLDDYFSIFYFATPDIFMLLLYYALIMMPR